MAEPRAVIATVAPAQVAAVLVSLGLEHSGSGPEGEVYVGYAVSATVVGEPRQTRVLVAGNGPEATALVDAVASALGATREVPRTAVPERSRIEEHDDGLDEVTRLRPATSSTPPVAPDPPVVPTAPEPMPIIRAAPVVPSLPILPPPPDAPGAAEIAIPSSTSLEAGEASGDDPLGSDVADPTLGEALGRPVTPAGWIEAGAVTFISLVVLVWAFGPLTGAGLSLIFGAGALLAVQLWPWFTPRWHRFVEGQREARANRPPPAREVRHALELDVARHGYATSLPPAAATQAVVASLTAHGGVVTTLSESMITGSVTVRKRPSLIVALLLAIFTCGVFVIFYIVTANKTLVEPFTVTLAPEPGGTRLRISSTGVSANAVFEAITALPRVDPLASELGQTEGPR